MTYEDYVEKKIFEPLGMKRSMYCNSAENVARRAHGYGMRNGVDPPRADERAHLALRRRLDLLDGGGHGHLAPGAARRQGALAEVVRRDDHAVEARTTARRSGTAMGRSSGKDSRGLRYIGMTAAASALSPRRRGIPDAQLAVVVLMNSNRRHRSGWWPTSSRPRCCRCRAPTGPFTGDATPLVGTYKGPGRGTRHGRRGDADAAGDRVLRRRRRGAPAAVGRGLDVPPAAARC